MTTTARSVSSRLAEIIRQVPGYDPYCGADEWRFDERKAQRALDFFQHPKDGCLHHVKGKWANQLLELEPWQEAIIANIFGWLSLKDKTRRYREVFVYLPRKNGKTTLAAGIVNYVLFCDKEPGAEIYSAAADREQATLVFVQVKGMILAEPELSNRAKIYQKAVVALDEAGQQTGSSYKAISAESSTKHGYNTHCAVIDELHAQKNSELVDVLETSTGSRQQPLMIYITTADFARESICNEKLDYARKVRDGIIDDPAFLPVIYEAPVDADWKDPQVWADANPNLGVSLSLEYIQAKCEKAKESPRFENTFKRLHLNIQTEQNVRWLPMDAWDACGEVEFTAEQLRGRPCFGAFDLSSKVDLTTLGLLFPDDELGWYYLLYAWLPAENKRAREKQDEVSYRTWIRQGHIETTPGNVIDYKGIRRKANELRKIYDIREIAFDPWNAQQLATELAEDDGFKMMEFRQGFKSMSGPAKDFEAAVLSGRFLHGNNPLLRWMASNVTVKEDPAENIKPMKSGRYRRIDGIITGVMCMGRALVNVPPQPSVYEEQGIIYV